MEMATANVVFIILTYPDGHKEVYENGILTQTIPAHVGTN